MFCGCATTSARNPTPRSARCAWACPARCRSSTIGVESAIRIGLALHCTIAPWCRFARKNYFYPDMPKNFQTTQYDEPIAFDGWLDVDLPDGTTYRVEIERAHMEEDTGKSLHVGGATGRIHGADYSLVDYNRAGIPLIEIVTKPMTGAGERAPEVARAYVSALRDLLRALGVSDVRDGAGVAALRRQRVAAAPGRARSGAGRGPARHAHRDQERQLAALGGAGRPLRDQRQAAVLSSGRHGRCRRPGTGTRTPA